MLIFIEFNNVLSNLAHETIFYPFNKKALLLTLHFYNRDPLN